MFNKEKLDEMLLEIYEKEKLDETLLEIYENLAKDELQYISRAIAHDTEKGRLVLAVINCAGGLRQAFRNGFWQYQLPKYDEIHEYLENNDLKYEIIIYPWSKTEEDQKPFRVNLNDIDEYPPVLWEFIKDMVA